MQALQGAREVLTVSGSRRQSQPFMSCSAGSLPNESVPFSQLARALPRYQDAILLLKRPWRWRGALDLRAGFVLHLSLLLHVTISSCSSRFEDLSREARTQTVIVG